MRKPKELYEKHQLNMYVFVYIMLLFYIIFLLQYKMTDQRPLTLKNFKIFLNFPGSDANKETVADLVKFIFNDCKPYKIRSANIYCVFPTPHQKHA